MAEEQDPSASRISLPCLFGFPALHLLLPTLLHLPRVLLRFPSAREHLDAGPICKSPAHGSRASLQGKSPQATGTLVAGRTPDVSPEPAPTRVVAYA
ncbi:hypothetical protein V8E51_009312 [Hyaloscypha variabilis]